MKVLMFGWEFPPHISGGLGTACFGLTKGLSKISDLEVLFVIPKAFGDEHGESLRLIGANQVPVMQKNVKVQGFVHKMNVLEVGVNLIPYLSLEQYESSYEVNVGGSSRYVTTNDKGLLPFSGAYGPDLFQEIANYSVVASVLGREQDFDIIHAHDWLTYPAGIAAKEASGKPLVVHVHATDFDRRDRKSVV